MIISILNEEDYDYNDVTQDQLDRAFVGYCQIGKFDRIKHILDSPEMKIRPNIHVRNDLAFHWLLKNKRTEIIDYLIFEKNIEMTDDILDTLKIHNKEYSEFVKNKFILRETNKDLNNKLPINENKVKKVKI